MIQAVVNSSASVLVYFNNFNSRELEFNTSASILAFAHEKSTYEPRPSSQCHPRNFNPGKGGAWCQANSILFNFSSNNCCPCTLPREPLLLLNHTLCIDGVSLRLFKSHLFHWVSITVFQQRGDC